MDDPYGDEHVGVVEGVIAMVFRKRTVAKNVVLFL
jgi:hypothetical protein